MPGLHSLIAAFEAGADDGAEPLDAEAVVEASDAAAAAGEQARAGGGPPAAAKLRRIAAKRLKAVDRRLAALDRTEDATALHDLRIAAKRLRYVLESAAPALGPAALDGAAAARELQTVLGDLHDCDVMLPRIAAHRRALRDADVAAVHAGQAPPNADLHRGVLSADVRVRARRARCASRPPGAATRSPRGCTGPPPTWSSRDERPRAAARHADPAA